MNYLIEDIVNDSKELNGISEVMRNNSLSSIASSLSTTNSNSANETTSNNDEDDDDKFYDALSLRSFSLKKSSINESMDDQNSIGSHNEMLIIEKFNKHKQLISKEPNDPVDLLEEDLVTKTQCDEFTNPIFIRALLNKKERDELIRLRELYDHVEANDRSIPPILITPSDNIYENTVACDNEDDLATNFNSTHFSKTKNKEQDQITNSNRTINNISCNISNKSNSSPKPSANGKRFEHCPSNFSNFEKTDEIKKKTESNETEKFKTWPEHHFQSSLNVINSNYNTLQPDSLNSIKQSSSAVKLSANDLFKRESRSSSFDKTASSYFHDTHQETKHCNQSEENNEMMPSHADDIGDEFINPVDKQIAAMTSHHRHSHHSHHHHHHGHHHHHNHHGSTHHKRHSTIKLSKTNLNSNAAENIINEAENNVVDDKNASNEHAAKSDDDKNEEFYEDIDDNYFDNFEDIDDFEESDDFYDDDLKDENSESCYKSVGNKNDESDFANNELNGNGKDDDDDDDEGKSSENLDSKKSLNSFRFDTLSSDTTSKQSVKYKTKAGFRRVLNRFGKAVKQVQNKAEEVLNHDKDYSESDSETINEATQTVKYKAARSNKSSHEFDKIQIIQILSSNNLTTLSNNSQQSVSMPFNEASNVTTNTTSPSSLSQLTNSNSIIWAMKFSSCGKLLATAGKDQLIRIWVLKSFYAHFFNMINTSNKTEDLDTNINVSNWLFNAKLENEQEQASPFCSKPLMIYYGHTSDILDMSWSKNLFLLSTSSDKTVKLWHIYKTECLCSFHHSSIVSSISFHPKDDRYFISATLDGKLRMWNISDKKVILWNDLNNLNPSNRNFITAVSFCQSGKTIAVGTHDGKCILYHTEHLKYYSLINVRSTRGRNSKGSKITGIEVLNNDENKILITSNDSRIRLYDLRDLSLVCKYKGFSNSTVHIKASLSPDDKFIVSGSRNKCFYIWKTSYHFSMLTSGRRDRNNYWERIQAHNAIVTCALFSPNPQLILNNINSNSKIISSSSKSKLLNSLSDMKKDKSNTYQGLHVLVSAAGCDGIIKVFVNKPDLVQ